MRIKNWITDEKRLSIIDEHLAGASKNSLARKYNLHSGKIILRWMRTFGIVEPKRDEVMAKKSENEEIIRLEKEIKELKSSLAYERMRADAYDTMIDIAEKELQIPIRKKSGTKQ